MKNIDSICVLSAQMVGVCERVSSITDAIKKEEHLSGETEFLENLLLDEVSHIQMIALEITKTLPAEETNIDESAFFQGELNAVKPNEVETPIVVTPEKEEKK